MEAPRRLYTTETGEICEDGDPRARFLLCAKGMPMTEEEGQRVGLRKYLEAYDKAHAPEIKAAEKAEAEAEPAEAKAVAQTEVEDKAVSGPTEEKAASAEVPEPNETGEPKTGAHVPSETRRLGGGGRRG